MIARFNGKPRKDYTHWEILVEVNIYSWALPLWINVSKLYFRVQVLCFVFEYNGDVCPPNSYA